MAPARSSAPMRDAMSTSPCHAPPGTCHTASTPAAHCAAAAGVTAVAVTMPRASIASAIRTVVGGIARQHTIIARSASASAAVAVARNAPPFTTTTSARASASAASISPTAPASARAPRRTVDPHPAVMLPV